MINRQVLEFLVHLFGSTQIPNKIIRCLEYSRSSENLFVKVLLGSNLLQSLTNSLFSSPDPPRGEELTGNPSDFSGIHQNGSKQNPITFLFTEEVNM